MDAIYNKEGEIDFSAIFKALFRRKKIIYLTTGILCSASFLFTSYERITNPIYQGSFRFLVNDPLASNGKKGIKADSLAIFDSLTTSVEQDIPTLIDLLQSPNFLKPFAEKYNLDSNKLAKNLDLKLVFGKQGRRSNSKGTVEVIYLSNNIKKGMIELNNLKNYFFEQALLEKRQKLVDGIKFLETQSPILERKADLLQEKLSEFRIKNNLVEPSREGFMLRDKLEEYELELKVLKDNEILFEDIKQKIIDEKLDVAAFRENLLGINPSSGQLGGLVISQSDDSFLKKATKLEEELAIARTIYLPSSKMILNLEEKLSTLKPEIKKAQLKSINIAINLNKGRIENLIKESKILNKQFLKQANLIESFTLLSEQLKFARLGEQTLIATIDKFKLEIAQNKLPWRILQAPAFRKQPLKPSFTRNLLIALFSGTFLGMILSLVRDTLDNVFHSPKEILSTVDLPILGKIPYTDIFDNLRTNEDVSNWLLRLDNEDLSGSSDEKKYQRFFYQESFRNLFTSIKFMGSESPLRTIVLTSTQPAEGKSLIASMLCKTLSEVGQKILLIDCDLRKPQLHKRLNLNNINGLSNILTQKNGIANWEKYTQTVPNHDTWKLITSGTIPPDPTRILSSQKMKEFINLLSENEEFDLIIFDTPPVSGLADSSLVGGLCDGLIYIVSLENVDKRIFKESLDRLGK
jgi:capsular exopolysaccharide synthesis family protein